MNDLWLGLALSSALANWIAVARPNRALECIAKPSALGFLLLWFWQKTHGANGSLWFSLGLAFSLVGDLFLLSRRGFLGGLVAFFLAHACYILGFNTPLAEVSPLWSLPIALVLALSAARLLRRIASAMVGRGERQLVLPVYLYGLIISLMLLSALMTLFRLDWSAPAALAAASGATLFYFSDLILAWDRFVTPLPRGRLWNMVLYHLGQFALALGAVWHWGV